MHFVVRALTKRAISRHASGFDAYRSGARHKRKQRKIAQLTERERCTKD